MAVYRNRAHAIAERLILLRKYILDNASPTRAVKAADMLNYLEDRGYKIKIKTLYADLDMLRTCFEVPIDYDKQKKGYILTKQEFEPYELRLIINSIQAAKFITQQEADSLTAKVEKLAGMHADLSLNRQVFIHNRARIINEDAMRGLDTIYEAIAQDRKISFKYFSYTTNNRANPRKYLSVNGSKILTASPYRVDWTGDTFSIRVILMENEPPHYTTFDLGYMEQIKLLSDKRDAIQEQPKVKLKRLVRVSDPPLTKLKVAKIYTSFVINKFGADTIITPFDDDFRIATINIRPTPDLYIWTQIFHPRIEIVFPKSAENRLREYFGRLAQGEQLSPPAFRRW